MSLDDLPPVSIAEASAKSAAAPNAKMVRILFVLKVGSDGEVVWIESYCLWTTMESEG